MSVSKGIKEHLPIPYEKQRYYTPEEVALHNTANDCWIILFGQVYDLTKLIQLNISDALTRPLIAAAGNDLTYWFDNQSREPRVHINLENGLQEYYCPDGQYLHLNTQNEIKWWKDMQNIIGKLTKRTREIKLQNMTTDHITVINVPCEETINEILTRYKKFNKHGGSYIWKRLGRPLDMAKTLTENGIEDESTDFERLGIMQSMWYIPIIHLFFNDDLTVA